MSLTPIAEDTAASASPAVLQPVAPAAGAALDDHDWMVCQEADMVVCAACGTVGELPRYDGEPISYLSCHDTQQAQFAPAKAAPRPMRPDTLVALTPQIVEVLTLLGAIVLIFMLLGNQG